MLDINKDIILFYRSHKYDYRRGSTSRSISGFMSWYVRLVKALKQQGCNVIENDFEAALANPKFPVGLVGTPDAIKNWNLPNPAILGPSMYDHPLLNRKLMDDSRFKTYLFTCDWLMDVFRPYYKDKVGLWKAGIELDEWPDFNKEHKDYDVLIYDKMRWTRDVKIKHLLEPIKRHLDNNSINYYVLEYGNISHEEYRDLLKRNRSMIFLCEHETQGMAYQEALACNIPILAWDPGYWVDPLWEIYAQEPVKSTSVPDFAETCGYRFRKITDFEKTFNEWWLKLDSFKPREFVANSLSLEKSATEYLKYYRQIYEGA